jgi:hypothetical protein
MVTLSMPEGSAGTNRRAKGAGDGVAEEEADGVPLEEAEKLADAVDVTDEVEVTLFVADTLLLAVTELVDVTGAV